MVNENDELESSVNSPKQGLKDQHAESENKIEQMEEHFRLERSNQNLQNDVLTVGGESERLSTTLKRAQTKENERYEEVRQWHMREAERCSSVAAKEAEALAKEQRMSERKLTRTQCDMYISFTSQLSMSKGLSTADASQKQLRENRRTQKYQKLKNTLVGRSWKEDEFRRQSGILCASRVVNGTIILIKICFLKKKNKGRAH
eukprot:134601_1